MLIRLPSYDALGVLLRRYAPNRPLLLPEIREKIEFLHVNS